MTLYLASASPRRAALIKLLGVKHFEIRPGSVDEIFDYSESPQAIVQDLAFQKAEAVVATIRPDDAPGVVLGADTIVVLGDKILGKPLDATDAQRMLRSLASHTHTVFTGVALIETGSKRSHAFFEKTQVTFRDLSDEEISAYIATGSPMDKAGAYGIQEDHGAVFVKKIVGDYYNVVGLPLCSLYEELLRFSPELLRPSDNSQKF
jgi:septum formation protein